MNDDAESNRINATALRRIDPTFNQLYGTASQVAVYRYNSTTQSWDKTDTVGCLFLYGRKVNPQYGLVVMNRKNANNFLQKFGPDAQFVMNQPYILIRAVEDLHTDPRDGTTAIHCIWFYEPKDCVASANILRNMGLKFEGEGETFDKVGETSRRHLDQNSPSSMGNHAGNVLFQILRKGKEMSSTEKMGAGKVMTAEELESIMLRESVGNTNKPVHSSAFTPRQMVSRVAPVTPLNKEQLHQAFLYLLQNDPDFVKKLHDAYLKSVQQNPAYGGH